MSKPTHPQTHQAGRHLVVAEALLRGYPAALHGRWTYVQINGHVAQVQVAAQGTWMVDDVDKYVNGTVETKVLVDVTGGVREFYIVPGDQLRRDVARRHAAYLERFGGTRPRNPASKHVGILPEQVRRWRNRWSRFD